MIPFFDEFLIEKWQESGIQIPLAVKRAADKTFAEVKHRTSIVLSAVSFGIAMSFATIPTYSATLVAPGALIEGAASRIRGEVPPDYWPRLVKTIAALPRFTGDGSEIEPFI